MQSSQIIAFTNLLEMVKPTEPSQKKHRQIHSYLERSENHNMKKGALALCPSDVARLSKHLKLQL